MRATNVIERLLSLRGDTPLVDIATKCGYKYAGSLNCIKDKDDVKVSAVDSKGQAMLVGKILICKHDDKGREVGLDADDIDRIKACVCTRTFIKGEY